MIQVRHLTKSFGAVTAVSYLSFDAPDGAITGFLGANGAGKTTTLRAIAGVLKPDTGTILVGDPLSDPSTVRTHLGALFDHHGLYPRLTAREHLWYFGRLRGLGGPGLRDRVDGLVSTLGLTGIADRRTSGFSQGERLKVSLACALIHAPRHLLLDEPTNGLDVPTVRALRTLLKTLRDSGTCILFSSHVLSEIEGLCDRIVIIARGKAVAEGTLDDVRSRAETEGLEDAFVKLTAGDEGAAC
jgi:sodium transport system ATP-binding protein